MNQFDPLATLNRLLRGWWLMVLLAVLGGLLGRLAAAFLPPVYVAQAEYYVSVDYDLFMAGHDLDVVVSLDLREPLNAVEDVIYSDDVIASTLGSLDEAGLTIPEEELRQRIRLDRYYTTWMFAAQHPDPGTAARMANAWAQASDRALQEAFRHAEQARLLSLETALLETCFSSADLHAGNACAGTSFPSVAEFSAFLDERVLALADEQTASRLIDPALKLELVALAEAPAEPQRNAPAVLLLAGAAIGWLIGLSLASTGFPPKRKPE